ncbi:MAG: SDR family NAD(P)-dependent oxidoreductase [Pseudomonadota bacterium]
MSKSLQDKIAVVTGASRGIGYATAKALASEGAHIIAVARTVGGLEELDDEIKQAGGSATLVPLDLKDGDGIDRLGAALFERWQKLDILIGNAGILGRLTPLGHLKPEEWDDAFAVNVAANWRLIRSLDPLLRAAPDAHALFVTSRAAALNKAYWGTYGTTKAALDALAKTYAAECATTGVCVNLISPGPVRTALRASAMPGEDAETLPAPAAVGTAIADLLSGGKTEQGATYRFDGGRLEIEQ